MVIPRRQRSPSSSQNDSQWLNQRHASRPWDSDLPNLKPPAPVPQFSVTDRKQLFEEVPPPARQSNPLNAFLHPNSPSRASSSSPSHSESSVLESEPSELDLPLTTRIGNRNLQPLLHPPQPPPLVGLPIPSNQHQPIMNPLSMNPSGVNLPSQITVSSNAHIAPPPPPPLPPMDDFEQGHSSRRFSVRQSERQSVRHSIRVKSSAPPDQLFDLHQPSNDQHAHKPTSTVPTLPHPGQLDLLPDSSSFLDFNDDHRLNPAGLNAQAETSTVIPEAFDPGDDADSFDTFASCPKHDEPVMDQASHVRTSRSNSTEKPEYPSLSFHSTEGPSTTASRRKNDTNDDEDGGFDVPACMSTSPDANRAMRDLQRASITAANELANSIRLMSQQDPQVDSANPIRPTSETVRAPPSSLPGNMGDPNSKLQGQIFLRSRIFRRWNVRYGSIVNQAYFGSVLLLFRSDSKPIFQPSIKLKSSKMIALSQSTITVQAEPRKHSSGLIYLFSLTTSQRTYTFGCHDPDTRSLWVASLSSAVPK